MAKNFKLNLLTISVMFIIILSCVKIAKTYQYDRNEGRFEAFMVLIIACSNGLLIRTLKSQPQEASK